MGTALTVKGKAYRDRTSLRAFISPPFVKESKKKYYFRCGQKPIACWQETAVGIFSTKASCSYLTSTGLAEQSAFSGSSVDAKESSWKWGKDSAKLHTGPVMPLIQMLMHSYSSTLSDISWKKSFNIAGCKTVSKVVASVFEYSVWRRQHRQDTYTDHTEHFYPWSVVLKAALLIRNCKWPWLYYSLSTETHFHIS